MRIRITTAAFAVFTATALVGCDPAEPTDQGGAVMCEKFVKDKLKSPGSAEFAGVTETKIKTLSAEKPWRYQVTAWVDSQNDFGAKVRNNYVCMISTKGDDKWTLENLDFTDPH